MFNGGSEAVILVGPILYNIYMHQQIFVSLIDQNIIISHKL